MTGRGVEQTVAGATLIDDSFNGNPASMVAALDSLKARPLQKGRRIAILGDMLELGDEAPAYHDGLAQHLDGIDGVYCVGPLMRHLYDLLPADKGLGWHEDPATLEPRQIAAAAQGRRRRGGEGQQENVLGEQVRAEACRRPAGKDVTCRYGLCNFNPPRLALVARSWLKGVPVRREAFPGKAAQSRHGAY